MIFSVFFENNVGIGEKTQVCIPKYNEMAPVAFGVMFSCLHEVD